MPRSQRPEIEIRPLLYVIQADAIDIDASSCGSTVQEEKMSRRALGFALPGSLGLILLAIWLILTGLGELLGVHFPSEGVILGLLALVAGVLILIGR